MDRNWLVDDFTQALARLTEALAEPVSRDVEKAGCIQYFEFGFELAWKVIRNAVESQGLEPCLSPKACLKAAFALGRIEDEQIWLRMLEARNKMSHTYDAKRALEIYSELPGFLGAMGLIKHRLSELP